MFAVFKLCASKQNNYKEVLVQNSTPRDGQQPPAITPDRVHETVQYMIDLSKIFEFYVQRMLKYSGDTPQVLLLHFLGAFLFSNPLVAFFSPLLCLSLSSCAFYVCAWEAVSDRLVVNVFSQGIRRLLMKYRCSSHGQINKSTNREERSNTRSRTHPHYNRPYSHTYHTHINWCLSHVFLRRTSWCESTSISAQRVERTSAQQNTVFHTRSLPWLCSNR